MSPSCRQRVLVLGDDIRMTLPVVRSLGRQRIRVHSAWTEPDSPVRSSRYIQRRHELPDCSNPLNDWIPALQSLLQQVPFNLVIPTTERVVHAIQQHRKEFEPYAAFALLTDDVFRAAFDKTAMQRIAEAAGVRVPESRIAETHDEVDRFLSACTGPVVVKPSHSVTDHSCGQKQFVQIFEDHSDCRTAAGSMLDRGRSIVLQEFFSGYGVGVEFLAKDGRVLTAFQHRRIHETSGHGSTYRVGQAVSPELLDATERILSAINYTGVGMCEFRLQPSSGNWVFLELNARFWGSLPLAIASGADFPWFLYQMLIHGRTDFPQRSRTGLRCRNLHMDLRWMWRAIRQRGLGTDAIHEQARGWRLNETTRPQFVRDFLRFLSPCDRIDSLTVDDPGPFFMEAARLLSRRLAAAPRISRLFRSASHPPDTRVGDPGARGDSLAGATG